MPDGYSFAARCELCGVLRLCTLTFTATRSYEGRRHISPRKPERHIAQEHQRHLTMNSSVVTGPRHPGAEATLRRASDLLHTVYTSVDAAPLRCADVHAAVLGCAGQAWRWEQVDVSRAWNLRAGPQLQWLGPTSRHLLFNDLHCRRPAAAAAGGEASSGAASGAGAALADAPGEALLADPAASARGPPA